MIDPEKIAALNRTYTNHGIDPKSMKNDPIDQFSMWFSEMIEIDSVGVNAMALATSTKDGRCSVRTILLKQFDQEGFVFFTNYESTKGHQLEENPYAALNFHWPQLHRDVRIQGAVVKVSPESSEEYFYSRPRESQLAAVVSAQSECIEDRHNLEVLYDALDEEYANANVPYVKHWGGYRVIPDQIEFWQGREKRLHDRVVYERTPNGWLVQRLAP